MVMGGCKGVWEGGITFMRCDSSQGSVIDVTKVCQLMERCDAHGRSVQEQKIRHVKYVAQKP